MPGRFRELRDTVPIHVEAALDKALAKLPADRFPTGAEFAEALAGRGFRTLEGSAVTQATATGELEQPGRRKFISWRVALMLIFAVGGGALLGLLAAPSDSATSSQVVWFAEDVQLGDVNYGAPLDIAPNGSRIVYVGRSEAGRSVLYRRELHEPEPILIAGTEGVSLGLPTISPDGQSLGFYSNQEFRTLSVQGGAVRSIAPMTVNARGADWGPEDLIVFQTDVGAGLSTVSAEGGEVEALTTPNTDGGETDHRWPHILPDGKSVLFTIWRGSLETAELAIASLKTGEYRGLIPGTYPHYVSAGYLVYATAEGALRAVEFDMSRGEVQGTQVTVLDSVAVDVHGAAHYALSANGSLAFFSSSPRRSPMFVDRSGLEEQLSLAPGLYASPRLSPDGTAFAVGIQGNVWIYDFEPRTFSPLTFEGGFYPLWTPDGRNILFSRDEAADVNIYEIPVDRAHDPVPVLQEPGQHRTQSLTSDGRHLMIRRNIGGRYELWVLDRESEDGLESWLATDFLERAPEFSPDGRWVAYTSDESDRDEVYVRAFPGPGGRVQISTDGGTEPAWSRDGGELFFRSGDSMLVVPVELGDTFRQLSQPKVLFEGRYYAYSWSRHYDPHPDGNRFLMLRTERQSSGMAVVMNWFQGELQRMRSR